MNRRKILKMFAAGGAVSLTTSIDALADQFTVRDDKMPVFFIGHGSPMNALEDNHFVRGWKQAMADVPRRVRFFAFRHTG